MQIPGQASPETRCEFSFQVYTKAEKSKPVAQSHMAQFCQLSQKLLPGPCNYPRPRSNGSPLSSYSLFCAPPNTQHLPGTVTFNWKQKDSGEEDGTCSLLSGLCLYPTNSQTHNLGCYVTALSLSFGICEMGV